MSGSIPPRDPSFQSPITRRHILAAYWAVILLALPLWWHTTSIQRLSLPTLRVFAQSSRELSIPVTIQLAEGPPTNELQVLLNDRVVRAPQRWKGVSVTVSEKGSKHNFVQDTPGTYTVFRGRPPPLLQNRALAFPFQGEYSLDVLADILTDLLAPYSASSDREHRVAHYAPRYRLAFTLLNEDGAEGKAAFGWDIPRAISDHITPILKDLSLLHNFTIESQVQFHAPLAFEPQPITVNHENAFGLTQEDLTIFVNSAEWTLSSSVSNDPVLHFVLFIPSASRRPLRILDEHGIPSSSNAFLLPQWGGFVILNPPADTPDHFHLSSIHLSPIFSAFSTQLLALLGVPQLPLSVRSADSSSVLTGWQFDALVRRRALENTLGSQETLKSIVKLVDQIENMPVGQYVKGDVLDALSALDKLYVVVASSPTLAFQYSREALSLGSRAFFNPGMLALLYFPVEHKYAVYAPLFASAMIPLVFAVFREAAAWRRERKKAAKGKEKAQ